MIDTKILLSVVIVVLIGVAAAGYHINSQNLGFWQPTTTGTTATQSQDTSQGSSGLSSSSSGQEQTTGTGVYSSGTSKTGGSSVISSSAAKTAAQSAINEQYAPGVTAGTPKLSSDGTFYTVPANDKNGNRVGEIEVDAKTGKVIGGHGSSSGGVA